MQTRNLWYVHRGNVRVVPVDRGILDVRAGREGQSARQSVAGNASRVHKDRPAIPFVTVDPPGSRDLDQAVHAEREGSGYRVRYAIADVVFQVGRGGTVEREACSRGCILVPLLVHQPQRHHQAHEIRRVFVPHRFHRGGALGRLERQAYLVGGHVT
ncbi:hypothetical protein BH23GEM3_BH23GEM3_20030 [soil metagenome]